MADTPKQREREAEARRREAAELRVLIGNSTRRAFMEGVTPAVRVAAERGEFPRALRDLVLELGLDRVLVPDDGDSGATTPWRQAEPVVRACGEFAVPLPLPEALVGRWLLARAGLAQPEGLVTVAPAGPVWPDAGELVLERVPWGRQADWVVVTGGASRCEILLVPGTRVNWTAGTNLAGEPRDRGTVALVFHGERVPTTLPVGILRYLGGLLRASQAAGAARALLGLSTDYAGQRQQFGRPLARFQVIQHQLARLAEVVAAMDGVTAAAWQALEAVGIRGSGAGTAGRDARLLMAAAKATTGSLTDTATGIAHQVHGAIGFTAEFSLHHFTRRLWSWRAEFGGPAAWHEELGGLALRRGGEGLWADLTAVMDQG
jgi:acyl-CoA dehydrogenase